MLFLPKRYREEKPVSALITVTAGMMLALQNHLFAGASDYLETQWLKTLRGNSAGTSFTAPTHVYALLHKADPTDSAPATTGRYGTTGVDRTLMELAFGAPTGTTTMAMNGSFTPTWPSLLTADTITHISIWDSNTTSGSPADPTGNCLVLGALTTSATVAAGDTVVLSSCTITCD